MPRPRSVLSAALALAILALPGTSTKAFQSVPAKILSTAVESAELDRLRRALVDGASRGWDSQIFAAIKNRIQDFMLRQLQAAPEITPADLNRQIAKLYGPPSPGFDAETDEALTPLVNDQLVAPPPYSKLWTLAYLIGNGGHGPGSSEVVVDCYHAAKPGARLVGRRDADFSGYFFDGRLPLSTNINAAALLVYGRMTGSNGLGTWKAGVYQCSTSGLRLAWQSPELIGLQVTAGTDFMTLRYVQVGDLGPASAVAAWTYELYEMGGAENGPLKVTRVTRIRKPQ